MEHLHYESIAWEGRRLIGRCRLCPLVREYDPEGKEPPVVIREGNMGGEMKPDNWDTMTRKEKKRFFNDHKVEITEDLKTLRHAATLKKWGMASSTLSSLKRRWHIGDEIPLPPRGRRETKKAVPVFKGKPLDGLPSLPPWSDTWPESVQLKWLDIWESLRVRLHGTTVL